MPDATDHPIRNPELRALAHWYARRIVNVNINIIAAGLLALIPVSFAVYAIHKTGLVTNPWWITAITFVLDVVFDFSIYFALHYLANHGPLRKIVSTNPAYKGMSFLHDAGIVQVQRAILSPLLYIIWLGTQSYLLHHQILNGFWATAAGGVLGIGTTRVIHTYWMLQEEKRRAAKLAAAPASAAQP
ncbi:MAG TPA: hypothetical protein VF777_05590 [Phycisphaerales bacterium]